MHILHTAIKSKQFYFLPSPHILETVKNKTEAKINTINGG